MHDELPDDEPMENNLNNDVNLYLREDHIVNLPGTRGRQERDRLVNDHFAMLQ